MPNWCDNEINFYTNSKEEMQELLEFLSGTVTTQEKFSGEYHTEEVDFCFNSVRPMPPTIGDNWYDWRLNNWGTKWEPTIDCFDLVSEDWLVVSMTTAWGPPEGIYNEIASKFPDVEIDWFYKEPGMKIAGWLDAE